MFAISGYAVSPDMAGFAVSPDMCKMNKMKGSLLKIHIQRSGIGSVFKTVFGRIFSAGTGAFGLTG